MPRYSGEACTLAIISGKGRVLRMDRTVGGGGDGVAGTTLSYALPRREACADAVSALTIATALNVTAIMATTLQVLRFRFIAFTGNLLFNSIVLRLFSMQDIPLFTPFIAMLVLMRHEHPIGQSFSMALPNWERICGPAV